MKTDQQAPARKSHVRRSSDETSDTSDRRARSHAPGIDRVDSGRGWIGVAVGVSLILLVAVLGCNKSDSAAKSKKPKFQVAEENDQASKSTPAPADGGNTGANHTEAPRQPPSIPSVQLNDLEIPEGTPEQLLAFIEKKIQQFNQLLTERKQDDVPTATAKAALRSNMLGILESELAAAEKILAANPDVEIRKKAVEAKLHALRFLSMVVPDKPWLEQIRSFARTLVGDEDSWISLQGRTILFGLRVGSIAEGSSKDVKGLMNDMKMLLANDQRGPSVLTVTQQATMALRNLGYEEQTLEAFKLIIGAFKDSKDPQLAAAAADMVKQLKLLDLGIDAKLDAAMRKEGGSAELLLQAIQTALNQPEPGEQVLSKAMYAVMMLEQTGQYELGINICGMVQQRYKDYPQEQVRAKALPAVEKAVRRLKLVGKPLVVEGVAVDGTPFDFTQYKGKVVLVDFWATWCGPCLEELPNVRENFQQYHEKGFEVIGISLDANRDDLNRFLQSQKLPWKTIVNNKMVEKCGVESIPFVLLLDRNGIVVDLHVRGRTLGEKLTRLLGPPAARPATSPPISKPGINDGPPTPNAPPGPKKSSLRQDRRRESILQSLAWAGEVSLEQLDDAPDCGKIEGKPDADKQASDQSDDEPVLAEADEQQNPYLAPADLSTVELIDYLLDMEEKPKSIRSRPGFAEAVVDAADRILTADVKDQYHVVAALAKFSVLHGKACLGDEEADRQLLEFVNKMRNDSRPAIARRVAFFQLERQAMDADQLPLDKVPDLLDQLRTYFSGQRSLSTRHLRLASLTVHVINRLDEEKIREKHFSEFGKLFAKGEDKQLARYGKKLMGGKGSASDLVGKPLQLEGTTALGTVFDWQSYRGNVVIVDFWATWCGPCLREMPHLRAIYEKHKEAGLDVVAVNLDKDLDSLAKYLKDKNVPWINLIGDSAQQLASRYGVRGIPTMMLVDGKGTVVAVGHKVAELEPELRSLLAK